MIITRGTELHLLTEEERREEKALDEMTMCIAKVNPFSSYTSCRMLAHELYRAGYRKFEIVEEDV